MTREPVSLAGLEAAMARYAGLLASVDDDVLDHEVPACPGWSARDLTRHLGGVHRWAAAIVLSGSRVAEEPEPLVTGPLGPWYEGCAAALLTALRAVDPAEPTPNFSRLDETAAFWPRRQLHETTVHAVDLAQSLGEPEDAWGVTSEVAEDGVAEVVRVFFTRLTARGRRPHVTAPVRLEATDTGRSWTIAPGVIADAPPVLRHGDVPTDDVVRGTGVELYLGLWRRLPHERLEVHGAAATTMLSGPLTA